VTGGGGASGCDGAGMNKMVVSQHDKLFVTNDAATIIKELDVVHPAAKMLVMFSQMQEQECGDGTNLVLVRLAAAAVGVGVAAGGR
jgi:chaperonin GroEL (HSP60 family)